jgi:formate-dependent nitrite reductase membrane component NrfD
MLRTGGHIIFQKDWSGAGDRGFRDFLLIPAIFFGAVSPGLFISSMIFNFIPGYWIALAMNLVGYGLTHLLFLGKMDRFWRAMANWRTSWISRGFVFNALFSAFGFLYALSESSTLQLLSGQTLNLFLRYAAISSAVLFAGYPGFMLSVVKAIPFWRSFLEPILFFLQALLGGTALHILSSLFISVDPTEISLLLKLNLVSLILVMFLILAALIVKASHGGTEKISVNFLMKSSFSPLFIFGALGAGIIIPLFVLIGQMIIPLDFGENSFIYYLSMALELAGIYIAKYSILRAGAYKPLT